MIVLQNWLINSRNKERHIERVFLMAESAFKGTVKEGFKRRFTVINERDLHRYLEDEEIEQFEEAFDKIAEKIEYGRSSEGKKSFNSYVVINLDEPYIDEIIEIMKRNGHWG